MPIPGRRPRGPKGYQLVALKIVEEMNRTLIQNTDGELHFSTEEVRSLSDLFNSSTFREFVGVVTPTSIQESENFDLCSMFTPVFWGYAPRLLISESELKRYDPSFFKTIVKGRQRMLAISGYELADRFKQTNESIPRLANFAIHLDLFMANRSPNSVKKLIWSFLPNLSNAYRLSKAMENIQFHFRNVTLPIK
jgi:hypothetical protein